MNTSNKRTPKLLSLLLTVCMVLSLLPMAAFAAGAEIPIDETNFPDANFREFVRNFDVDKNGSFSQEEISKVTEISIQPIISDVKFHDLTGIEHFSALEVLNCTWNSLTSLDVSHNTALKELYCVFCGLTELDVTHNPELTVLACNSNQLTTLDVSKNHALNKLSCKACNLASLDLTSNPNLTVLECFSNQLTSLDISKNPALTELHCSSNLLTSLDLSHTPNLTVLTCSQNQLTSLNLSSNPSLNFLYCTENEYTVNQRENITLPGNLDASKASNVVGGKFDTANNTFSFDAGVNEATYQYDTSYTGTNVFDAPIFKLVYDGPAEPETKPTEPETQPTEPETKPTEPETKPTEPETKPTEPETKPTEPAQNPFTDISTDEYFYEPVLWAVNNGITSGVSADKFGPSVNCTRGQIATFLWAAAGKPEPTSTSNPFTDVAESDYYYKAVLWAVEKGITSGMSADKFGPNVTCTRAQTVTFLWAAQGKPVVESAAAFSDVASGDYYYNAVKWAVENKVTAGVGGDRFGPSQDCLRGQIVTFLYKTFA